MSISVVTHYWIEKVDNEIKTKMGGGITNYTFMLFNFLKDYYKIKTDVIFRSGNDSSNFQGPKNQLLFSLFTLKYCLKTSSSLIICQGGWSSLLPVLISKYFFKKKYNVAYIFHTQPSEASTYLIRKFYNFLFNQTDKLCFVSNKLKRNLIRTEGFKLDERKIAITYAGIDNKDLSKYSKDSLKQKYNSNGKYPILLGLGLMYLPYKAQGVIKLIKSLHKIIEYNPNAILILTGNGQYKTEVEEFVKNQNLGKHVIFTGHVKDQWELIKLCDIYTHISLGDGLPISIYENMSAGNPIVTTYKGGGSSEIITNLENGILVRDDPVQISAGINILTKNKILYEKISKNSRKTIEEKFSGVKMAATFYEMQTNV